MTDPKVYPTMWGQVLVIEDDGRTHFEDTPYTEPEPQLVKKDDDEDKEETE